MESIPIIHENNTLLNLKNNGYYNLLWIRDDRFN